MIVFLYTRKVATPVKMFLTDFFLKSRLHAREANEVRAETEASTLAGRDGHGRRKCVKESKCGERRRADRKDLTEVGLLGV